MDAAAAPTLHPDGSIEWAPRAGAPDLLFLLFHGVGATPRDLAPLGARLAGEYPQAVVLSVPAPDAFDAVPGGGAGRQWFSIVGVTEADRPARVAATLPRFVQTVRALQRRHDMPWPRTALVGFSQGAIMALEAVQAEPQLAGRVIAFSGRYATPPAHAPHDVCVHLLHGLADPVIPPGPVIDAGERLVALGADVTADLRPGIGHELNPELVELAVERLRGFLPKKLWRQALADAPIESRVASSRELGRDRGTGAD